MLRLNCQVTSSPSQNVTVGHADGHVIVISQSVMSPIAIIALCIDRSVWNAVIPRYEYRHPPESLCEQKNKLGDINDGTPLNGTPNINDGTPLNLRLKGIKNFEGD